MDVRLATEGIQGSRSGTRNRTETPGNGGLENRKEGRDGCTVGRGVGEREVTDVRKEVVVGCGQRSEEGHFKTCRKVRLEFTVEKILRKRLV